MTVGPIWNTGGTEMEIIVPVSVLGPQRAGTEMGGDHNRIPRYMIDVDVACRLPVPYTSFYRSVMLNSLFPSRRTG